jgi:hypothetical protein
LGRDWANIGQTLGKHWANIGQTLGKHWANIGQTLGGDCPMYFEMHQNILF